MLHVLKDRSQGAGRVARAAIAVICAASLSTPTVAHARAPEGPAPSTAETSEELTPQAEKHAYKALEHFNTGAYVDSEEEFRRVAFYAPNWRPLHYNLAVLAEAQGKLGTAVQEYRAFRPHGSPDEQLLVDQRIDELGRRRQRIVGAYRRQIALSSTAMSLGVLGLAGASVGLASYLRRKQAYQEAMDFNAMLGPDEQHLKMDEKPLKGGLLYLSIYGGLIALMLVGYSVIPLRNAIRSKRRLDGLALGPTRLQWNGGAGVRLRF